MKSLILSLIFGIIIGYFGKFQERSIEQNKPYTGSMFSKEAIEIIKSKELENTKLKRIIGMQNAGLGGSGGDSAGVIQVEMEGLGK